MTLFSKESKLKGVGTLLVSALVLFFASCTEVDDNLGGNIIPSDQKFEVKFATLTEGFESYLTYTDSVATSNLDYAYFGKMTSPHYGAKMRAAAMVQFEYGLRSDTIAYDDRDSKIDSLALLLGMKYLSGDTLKAQSFDVYRIEKKIEKGETYYNGTDYKEFISSRPMFSCEFKGKPRGATSFDTLSLRVVDATLAEQFMQELWRDTTLYATDSLFMDKFKGLCIVPSESSPEDAAIYGMNLQWDTDEGPSCYLLAYGHEYPKGDSPELVEDEVFRAFSISNDAYYTSSKAVSVFEHDYSATDFGDNINYDVLADEALENPVKVGYVEGVMGVTTTIEFSEEFVNSLRALAPEGSAVFLNKAEMWVGLAEQDYTFYDYAPARLGTYTSYAKLTAVPDYNYYYEEEYDTELIYGGYLNRTFGRYELDLALYLQQLMLDESGEVSRRITLGMPAYDFLDYGIVKLGVEEGEWPVKFDITYTVIGK